MSDSSHHTEGRGLGALVLTLIGLALLFSILSPHFLQTQNILNIMLASSIVGVLAIGAAFVIGSAGIDLSVGSNMALSGCVAGAAMVSLGVPGWAMIVLCIATGAALGAINGTLIGWGRMPPFIATLGMLSVARGVGLIFTDGRPVYGLPLQITALGQGAILGVPIPVIIFLCTAIISVWLLNYSPFGTHLLCMGDNPVAVRNSGINYPRLKLKIYTLSGVLAGLAGVIFMGRLNSVDPAAGANYELTAITAAIIGGTSLFGGRASIGGAVIGALILGTLQNGLNLLAVQSYYQLVAVGIVLLLAVTLDRKRRLSEGA